MALSLLRNYSIRFHHHAPAAAAKADQVGITGGRDQRTLV